MSRFASFNLDPEADAACRASTIADAIVCLKHSPEQQHNTPMDDAGMVLRLTPRGGVSMFSAQTLGEIPREVTKVFLHTPEDDGVMLLRRECCRWAVETHSDIDKAVAA